MLLGILFIALAFYGLGVLSMHAYVRRLGWER